VQDAIGSPQFARFQSFEVNLRSGELSCNGQKIKLTEQCFQILTMLLQRPGEIVLRSEIQKKLWPNDTVVEFENSINAAIKKLRSALGDSADDPRYIETLARRGYRFMLSVEWVEKTTPQSLAKEALPSSSPSGAYLVGKKVSHYRVLDIIGGGGMGVVYQAEDLRLGRRVALKFLPEELTGERAALLRFQREAQAASALNHPNICTIHGIEEYEGAPFIVMEYLEGKTLRDALSTHPDGAAPLKLDTILDISIQIAKALDAAHNKGIIHRDIKPGNIFLTTQGQVKILDFGLAKVTEATGAEHTGPVEHEPTSRDSHPESTTSALLLSRTGNTMGTAGYMSPEQIRGEKLDARTDLFSFGLVLYELPTGRRAFSGDNAPELHNAILNHSPQPLRGINPESPTRLEQIIARALEKDRVARYQSALEMLEDLTELRDTTEESPLAVPPHSAFAAFRRPWLLLALLGIVLSGLAAVKFYLPRRGHASRITEKDVIMLADFTNSTGDPVFDSTLYAALDLSLRQSPLLNILYNNRIEDTLRVMGRSVKTPLTNEFASEVCRRAGCKAYLAGKISTRGKQYVLTLRAVNCHSGEMLSDVQTIADSKNGVLQALSDASAKLRSDLGESSTSISEYGVPLTQAATQSMEAFKEYNLALVAADENGGAGSLPHFLRAIQLDPNFALAYLGAGEDYLNGLGTSEQIAEYLGKAFELQDHATLPRRLQIAAAYYVGVTGQLDKVVEVYEKLIAIYPRDSSFVYSNLSIIYSEEGQYEKAVELARQAVPFDPDSPDNYVNLAHNLIALGRFEEAREVLRSASTRKPDSDSAHDLLYALGFLTNEDEAMAEQVQWLKSHKYEHLGWSRESDTKAYAGHLRKARELTREAVLSAMPVNREAAAAWWNTAALREASFGNSELAQQDAHEALKLAPTSQGTEMQSALAFAMAGDSTQVVPLIKDLNRRFPLDTQVQVLLLPIISAQLDLLQHNPEAALERLKTAEPVELGFIPFGSGISCMWANYLRGQAYLEAANAKAAVGEFQTILDHKGIVQNCETGVLAQLWLARANVLESHSESGDAARKARSRALAAYGEFFRRWKDADSDIPVLKQAKAEYARLQ
jgi:eukaryotic-like serine/threonine-protein kinase